jgi:transcriptional regulator with AAA-type ATPase domain
VVQRQVVGLFVVEERGSHELKGVPEPVTLYRPVRASGSGRRVGQRHLTPLIGREEEIAMLMRRWERAQQGNGQLVLMVGEPGIGKSRLRTCIGPIRQHSMSCVASLNMARWRRCSCS